MQFGAQRVECAYAGIAAFNDNVDQLGFKLRLLEDAHHTNVLNFDAEFLVNPLCARERFRRQGDGAAGFDVEMMLEVVIGIVEHDKGFARRAGSSSCSRSCSSASICFEKASAFF